MANPRFGLYENGVVAMFPKALANTSVSPTLLVASTYARDLENLLPNIQKQGSGAKRFGVGKKGDALTDASITELMEYRTTAGAVEFLAYCDDGSIRLFDDRANTWSTLKSGLSLNGLCRWVAFNEKLVIVDGINTPMTYDGSSVDVISEFVTDYDSSESGTGLASAATQTDTNTFTITVGEGRDDYSVGQSIKVTFETTGEVAATISAVSGSGTLTIDVTGTPFPSPSETITMVEYSASPPAFSDIYVELDRLWALSEGETKAKTFRARSDAMKVYYTDATNNEAAWFNAAVQDIGYINLAAKSRRFDELVRIKSIDGQMVFLSRLSVFIYAGTDPTTLGDFAWVKTLPVGCVNGSLVIEYPQDLLFFTQYGARSLQRVLQTDGLEVTPDLGSDIDGTVTQYVGDMLTSDANFRAARAFFYERDGLYGFNLSADNKVAVYALSEQSKGWTFFSGLFKSATAYLGTSDGRLLLASGGQLYAYGNGTDADVGTVYDDDGADITIKWSLPWMKGRGRWSNVGYEIVMEDVTGTTLSIFRAVDENDATITATSTDVSLTEDSAHWDEAYWDEAYWDGVKKRLIIRDKFLADSFSLIVQNTSSVGPISILGIKPIGR